jgi:hypothetical protein
MVIRLRAAAQQQQALLNYLKVGSGAQLVVRVISLARDVSLAMLIL